MTPLLRLSYHTGMAESKRRSSPKSKGNAGCLIWLIALSVVFVLIFLNIGRIRETLKSTKFMEIVSSHGEESPAAPPAAPVSPAPEVREEPTTKSPPSSSEDTVTIGPAPDVGPGEAPSGEPPKPNPAPPENSAPEGGAEKPPVKTRKAALYFVHIDGDGVMARQEILRPIPATDSPLTDAIESLLKGPSEDELRKDLITLIPQGTKLLSAQVRGTTAYLNFSEPFMYNSYGIEGYAGQLKQVVWTATEFPTVQDVQILVEGQRRDFLGGEGVYIGRPLSRNSF